VRDCVFAVTSTLAGDGKAGPDMFSADDSMLHSRDVDHVGGTLTKLALGKRLGDRKWPLLATVVFFCVGMIYMFSWNPVVHHNSSWVEGGDLWGIFRGAHYVGWGFLGGIYTPGNGIVTFPGMPVLLAPLAMLTGSLHLTESYGPFFLAHPSAALFLQPVELLLTATVMFAGDALAEQLNVPSRRRIWLCGVVGIIAWPIAAIWGHAEDALAICFALYAMDAMLKNKWSRGGWLLGFGIVMQPLVALTLPLFIGATPMGQRILQTVRSSLLSVLLVGIAFAGDAGDTYTALIKQPTPPSINHATPWLALTPRLTSPPSGTVHRGSIVPGLGHPALQAVTVHVHSVIEVSGGPGRLIDVVFAVLLGLIVWRHPQPPVRLLWLAAVILTSRCFFESVMTPYYLTPPIVLCLVLASRQGGKRFWSAAVIALELTVFAYHHLNPWLWWLPIVVGLTAILALAYPDDVIPENCQPEGSCSAGVEVHPDEIGERSVADGPAWEPALL